MKVIKVLGPGCKKCKQLEETVKQAIAQLGSGYEVIKFEDLEEMMRYNIMSSPGLVDLPEATLLRKVMKPRLIAWFFGSVTVSIILLGYLFNLVL